MAKEMQFRDPEKWVDGFPCGSVRVEARLPRPSDPGRARILLVEDEDPFRELIQAFLNEEGHEVHSVRDGRGGVQWLKTNLVDLIVTDLCMPHTDGLELLMSMKKLRSKIPIIVMSGGVGGESAGMLRAAELLGARHALPKPFALEQLASVVRETLDATATLR